MPWTRSNAADFRADALVVALRKRADPPRRRHRPGGGTAAKDRLRFGPLVLPGGQMASGLDVAGLDGDRVEPLVPGSIHRRQDLTPLYLHDGAVVAVSRGVDAAGKGKSAAIRTRSSASTGGESSRRSDRPLKSTMPAICCWPRRFSRSSKPCPSPRPSPRITGAREKRRRGSHEDISKSAVRHFPMTAGSWSSPKSA